MLLATTDKQFLSQEIISQEIISEEISFPGNLSCLKFLGLSLQILSQLGFFFAIPVGPSTLVVLFLEMTTLAIAVFL